MSQKRRVNWKTLRIISQTLLFILFCAYVLSIVYPLELPYPADTVFQLNPLTHIYLLISGHGLPYWGWALAAIVLTLLLARIFCGWMCPMGAMLDFVSGIRGRLKRWNKSRLGPAGLRANRPRQRPLLPTYFSVYLLVLLLVLAAIGIPLLWVFDPIVLSFKFVTAGLLQSMEGPLREAFYTIDNQVYREPWWAPVQQGFNAIFATETPAVYVNTAMFLGFMLLIFSSEFWQKRFWCRYICPLGAVLRLVYKLHPVKRHINEKCTVCLKCEAACHFGGTSEDDCVYCMECIQSCPHGAISFLPVVHDLRRGRGSAAAETDAEALSPAEIPADADTRTAYRACITGKVKPPRISRRLLFQYGAAGLIAYPLLKLPAKQHELPLRLLRPPGVGEADASFVDKCIKCGQCLKVCVTNGLQPTVFESGVDGLWSPRLIPRIGECEFECNLCGQVCPTGAIPELPLAEKKQFQIGMAHIDKMRCIPYITNHNCTVCEEHCPTEDKAIKMTTGARIDDFGNEFEQLKPYIEENLCIGCGTCERVCPVVGKSAIIVTRRTPGPAFSPIPEDATSVPQGYGNSPGASDSDSAEDYSDPYGLNQ